MKENDNFGLTQSEIITIDKVYSKMFKLIGKFCFCLYLLTISGINYFIVLKQCFG